MTTAPSGTYLFVSYSRRNATFVDQLRADLERNGFEVWIDRVGVPPGTSNWELTVREAISRASGMIYVASPTSLISPVIKGELLVAQMFGLTIYPVWAEGERWPECVPLELAPTQYTDCRAEQYTQGLAQLLATLRANAANPALAQPFTYPPPNDPALPVDAAPPRNPYKGLKPFREKDAGDFFGRTQLVDTLVALLSERLKLDQNRLIAVIGPSGSGKSSVVMAGMIPSLKKGTLPSSGNWIYLNRFLPGRENPVDELARLLQGQLDDDSDLEDIRRELDVPDMLGLHHLAGKLRHNPWDRVVLFIDQFEEIFTLVKSEVVREHFINLIVTAAAAPEGALVVILTLRADFYDRPMDYPLLARLIQGSNVSVLPMSLDELNDAITLPARASRLAFDRGLVGEIAFDLLDSRNAVSRGATLAGALPLLQFTLDRLYHDRQDYRLTSAAYEQMGRINGAIGRHAEDVFATLDAEAQACLPRVFYRLVTIDEHGAATRRRASRQDVTAGDAAAERLVDALVKARLLITDREESEDEGEAGPHATVEVTHEALLRSWDTLAGWISDTAEDIRALQRLQAEATEWERQKRPDRMLWDYEELRPVYDAISRFGIQLGPLVEEFIRPQTDRLLEDFKTAPEYRQRSIVDRFGQIGEDAAPALVIALAYAKGSEVRQTIDAILWRMPWACERELIAALQSEAPNIRRAAADAIARLGVIRAVPSLVANLGNPALRDRLGEIRALIALGSPEAINALTAHQKAERWEERQAVMQALGAVGKLDAVALTALREALKDTRQEVRIAAVSSLGQVRDTLALTALQELAKDKTPLVRAAAVEALGRLGDIRALRVMIDALGDHAEDVRCAAATALGLMKADQARSMLMFALRDKSAEVREAVAEALGRIGHHHALRPLQQEAQQDDDWKVRRAVIEAFYQLKTPNTRTHLRQVLREDRDWQVRQVAARLLGQLEPAQGVIADLLNRLEKDTKPEVRLAAVEALGELRATQATGALLELLKKPRPWPMRAALGVALGKIADPTSAEPLRALLEDRDGDAALGAALALSTRAVPEPRVIALLHAGLQDERSEVRISLMRALGTARATVAIQDLLFQLHDPQEDVRLAAAGALAAMPDEAIAPELNTLREHPFLGVRQAATQARRSTPA